MKTSRSIYSLVFTVALLITGFVAFTAIAADAPSSSSTAAESVDPPDAADTQELELLPAPQEMGGPSCKPKDRLTYLIPNLDPSACAGLCSDVCTGNGYTVYSSSQQGRDCICTCCTA